MLSEKAITREFQWTQDIATARKISLTFALSIQNKNLMSTYKAKSLNESNELLKRLNHSGIACAIVSRLPKLLVDKILNDAGINSLIAGQVCAEDDFERDMQGFLKASLKIRRQPKKCVIFDSRPSGIIQAHEANFKAVALSGVYPLYELSMADLSVRTLNEMKVLNVKRLFSYEVSDKQPLLQTEVLKIRKNRPVIAIYKDVPENEE
mmetsp:Transcript_15460/g.23007  ORF Transcript_15460/g.23007 Transcript_15460/m.23007 type:complete len:208 (+) Transcript_15460:447-1070(+)